MERADFMRHDFYMKYPNHLAEFKKAVIGMAALAIGLAGGLLAQGQTPVISNVSPNGAVLFQPSATLSFQAVSSVGINPDGISVQLTGVSPAGQPYTATLTGTNGLTVGGTAGSRSVSAPLSSNLVYTAVIRVVNAGGQAAATTVNFDTINPSLTFEAEDYDYSSGQFIDNPQTNAYKNLPAVDGVDAYNNNFSGGGSSYRPSGLNTEGCGDKKRAAYNGTGQTDYNVGWNNGGSGKWGNYTRTFPAGTYNIFMRGSSPGAADDGASLYQVTAGQGTSNQATNQLGTFSVPNTGDWQAYTWVPLLDTNGRLAQFTGGGMQTLRVMVDKGNYNVNFYLLLPADLSLPVITNLWPDGADFFQCTNQLAFTASSSAGLAPSGISVVVDGVNVSNALNAASVSFTTCNVTCPLAMNTNHTVVITVTGNNNQSVTRTISFNNFAPDTYQWEAEDYDYTSGGAGGLFFDAPQTNAYAGLPSLPGVDNWQADLTANPFLYRPNSPAPSTTLSGDGARPPFTNGRQDYNLGFFGGGSWVNYTRHYPAGTYQVWGRFAEGSGASSATLSQLTGGYGTALQTSNRLGRFTVPNTGDWQAWNWSVLQDDNGRPLKVRFDGSQQTLKLAGGSGQPEVNVGFFMLVPVEPDPLVVVRVINLGATTVQVLYSKPVEAATAANPANYVFDQGITVTSATLGTDLQTVTLTTSPLTYGTVYQLVINNVRDRMNLPNTIAPDTTMPVQALAYTLADLGNPNTFSTAVVAGNGLNITALGQNTGGTNDQGNFSWQLVSGDFDVAARVTGLDLSDVFAKAGWMARENLNANARFAAALTTPAMNGSFFSTRASAGGTATSTGYFPANYPNTWLRLKRTGSTFTGFASYDGQAWQQLGSASMSLPSQIYLGFSVSSHGTNNAATAQFRDIATVTNATTVMPVNPHERPGPSSRKTPIVFSEIMYKPAARADGANPEFIEIYNSNPWFETIGGWQITCADVHYTFPPGTVIPGGACFVIAASPEGMAQAYGLTNNVFGPYTGSLKKAETLQLIDERGAVLLTVPYTSDAPWPVAARGTGHSIVLVNPTYGEADPRAWDISDIIGGSPGQMEAFRPSPLRNVVINEFLAHTDLPDHDYVELYNHSTNAVNLSGCILTDDATTNKFIIPPGTILPARGFLCFQDVDMGFRLNAVGESVFFINPDHSRVLDAVAFGAQQNGVPTGRWPDGANDFYRLSAQTPGAANAPILLSDIVINELMYDPISGDDNDQYVELYNRGTNPVDMSGWQLNDGITYTIPNGTTLAADGYLVVAKNQTNLFAQYPNLTAANTVGNYSGKLAHSGEHIALTMPVPHKTTDTAGNLVTNTLNVIVNDLTYGTGGRWGQWSHAGGSSLELIDPNSNNRLAANWADSDETAKSVWTNIEYTGVLDLGANYDSSSTAITNAQFGLLDAGECLLDDVEVNYNGVNYVINSGFETGTNGWQFQGCHSRSALENQGYNGSGHSLRVRCSDRLWTGINSCQLGLSSNPLQAGSTATLRFKARWLHGWPEALLRLNGNWLEATGTLPIPANLGTPGQPNSCRVADAGAAIYNVTHTPTLPAAGQAVVVTANIHAPAGLQSLTLRYRLDPSMTYTSVTLHDDGVNGDAVAGDGIYSATIPGQANGALVAFNIVVTDNQGTATRFPAAVADNAPPKEGLVMFGDTDAIGGTFGAYHLWVSQTNANRWTALGNLSNEDIDAVMVCGNRVIYGAKARWAGSPYHQGFDRPAGNPCHYKWTFPNDDQFLGATSFNKIHQPGNFAGDDNSLQREQEANVFLRALGVSSLNRRYIVVYVNGNRRGSLMEDAQTPNGDMVNEYFPGDTGGYLFKMQPWFEFAPSLSGTSIGFDNKNWSTLNNYTTTGGAKKMASYRYTYLFRRTPASCNDYSKVYALVDAAGTYSAPGFATNLLAVADMENWMRVFAANHAAGNWDSVGSSSGQNLYGYNGVSTVKYSLMMFDFNICFGNSGSWDPGQNLFSVNGGDPALNQVFKTPVFRRMYWRALNELINGPLDVANSGPLMDAKYNVFVDNGLNQENPNTSLKGWITQARVSIAAQLAKENATSFAVDPDATVNGNTAVLTGTAPVDAATILINGVAYPVTWTSVTTWSATVPLTGDHTLNVTAANRAGQIISGYNGTVNATYNIADISPAGQVVLNEIMNHPATPGAEYVELYNRSTNTSFDLSGWSVNGLGYTFPSGATIPPGGYLVLAADRATYLATYGVTAPLFDTYTGALQPAGEVLSIYQPLDGTNFVVNRVRYEAVAPWPAASTGVSLQLLDAAQDNSRAGNWAMGETNAPAPQWVYVATNITATSSRFYLYLQSAGDVYIDEVKLVAGTVPEVGNNLLVNGDFESPLGSTWTATANFSTSATSTALAHHGNSSLHLVATSAGSGSGSALYQDLSPSLVNNQTYTVSFWYYQTTSGGPLTARLSNGAQFPTYNLAPVVHAIATPGAVNSVAAAQPAFPTLWLNEAQPENLTGPLDNSGKHNAWLELYNPGSNTVSLAGLSLSTNYNDPTLWSFPATASLAPGQFLVIFADGQTNLSTGGELHTSFSLAPDTGSVALSRMVNGAPQNVDYLNYSGLPADASYGDVPDGQPFWRQAMFHATPGTFNDGAASGPSAVYYAAAGTEYFQDFNTLPNPGMDSVNANNAVTINGIKYSLANPYDFAAPIASSGKSGGLGLNALNGWYGAADLAAQFGATSGDQTTGGVLAFGLPDSPNRALGLLATSSTGGTAFGVKIINATGEDLNYFTLRYVGELWRQSDIAKVVLFSYAVDPVTTNTWPATTLQPVTTMNLAFATDTTAKGGVAADGTALANQQSLGMTNQPVSNWKAGTALWLVWRMPDSTGKAQGLGLDDLSFSAAVNALPADFTAPALGAAITTAGQMQVTCATVAGLKYQLEASSDLTTGHWTPVGDVIIGTGAPLTIPLNPTNTQQFFRLRVSP